MDSFTFGQYLNKALVSAEDEAKAMGDEYVSVEHLFLSMLKNPSPSMKKIFNEFGITRERFLQALSTVRGNQRVVSDNPEATYDTLNKYGEDLVEKAKNQKLDPVIGRDMEIRNIIRILPVRPRTTRFSSVSLALVKQQPLRDWHSVLWQEMYRKVLRIRRFLPWIWVRWLQVPSIVVSLRNV